MFVIKMLWYMMGLCFVLTGGLIRAILNTTAATAKAIPRLVGNIGKWWDYDRNVLDNDIEQFRRVDGIGGL